MPSWVSIVIPCYNPTSFLHETLAGVRRQSYRPLEVILVNDGTDREESREILRRVQVDRVIEQQNRGLAAARNTGFRAARGEYVLPLDADDRITPDCVAACVAALQSHSQAAFVYPDYQVFGERRYREHTPEYNLWDLLWQNTLIYASLIRRADWEAAGGYDEEMRLGYEDWEFWLRLGERGRYGRRVPKVLFEYRKHGRSLLTLAQEHHRQLVAHIRARHPGLYEWEGQVRVKRQWAPAVSISGIVEVPQTIADWTAEASPAAPVLSPPDGRVRHPHAAEWCALASWGRGRASPTPQTQHPRPALHRHLVNAELDWRHPVRSALRLIPLRVKERVNRWARRPVFDLSFYLRFQPQSVLTGETLVPPLRYLPRPAAPGTRRLALVTPHLGPGGAESVLLEVAAAIDRESTEVFLLATQSRDDAWRARWEQAVDHVYDLAALVAPERMIAALYSIAVNWKFDAVIVQNSLAGYSAIRHWKRELPGLKVLDWIHAVEEAWDFVSSTAPVAEGIDVRVAISQAGVERLRRAGTPPHKIRLIRNGIDLDRFRPLEKESRNILFAGRLDPIKRPLLLADIAARLRGDFCFLVAGAGPEEAALRRRIRKLGLDRAFRFLGPIDDMPRVLADAAVVVIPSEAEGIPLIALEAFAMERPVVCSRAGAAHEAVGAATGVLIEPGPDEADRFAAALAQLLDDPDRRREMGRAGRRLVESEYSRERARAAYHRLLQEVL
jgi:glycosyltransferase involved in cell wall biosynthesis/GT2 family glycosyltransferase